MIPVFYRVTLSFAAGLLTVAPVSAGDDRVWIFAGLPGDAEHHAYFEKMLGSMKTAFTTRLGIRPENLVIYYGPKEAGYAGEATREAVLGAVKTIAETGKQSPGIAQWVFFIGHANTISGGAQLNLPGPDLTSMDLSTALEACDPKSPLTLFFTHTASAPFIRPLAKPGRVVITANTPGEEDNETDFPSALAESLNAATSDADKDGKLDATEIFQATRERVLAGYKKGGYIVKEAALLDGDGDGKGTQRPAEADANPAKNRFFTLSTEGKDLQ